MPPTQIENTFMAAIQQSFNCISLKRLPIMIQTPKTLLGPLLTGEVAVIAKLIIIFPAQLVHGPTRQAGFYGEQFSNSCFAAADGTNEDDLGFHCLMIGFSVGSFHILFEKKVFCGLSDS